MDHRNTLDIKTENGMLDTAGIFGYPASINSSLILTDISYTVIDPRVSALHRNESSIVIPRPGF
jgi:hypothetical protein